MTEWRLLYRSPLHCRSTLQLSTFHSTVQQPTALSLYPPTQLTHYTQLYRSPLHCRSTLPLSISLLDPNIFFGLPSIYCDLAALQSCRSPTPYSLVPSHNDSSRGSNLLSTLYMSSSPWCGLISPQCLAKCPHLSHNQHSVSVTPHHFIAQLQPSFYMQTVLYRVLFN